MSCHVLEVKAIETYLRHVCTASDRGGSGGNLIREKMLLKKKIQKFVGDKAWNCWRGTCCIALFNIIIWLWKPELAGGPIT